jgi:VRR-NUC domain
MRTPPATSEQAIQRALCQHLRQRGAAGLVWFHVPNGGRRNPVEAAIFSGLGVRAGVSDLILLHDSRIFALELKAERGRPTAAQMQFISEFRAAGGEASIVNGLDQALRTLETWKLLRGRAAMSRHCVVDNTKGLKP